jgi:TatD DNase family protein
MVDTHCHLDMCEDGSLERARDAGLSRIATIGMNPESFDTALGLAGANEDVFAIVGIHPNESAGFDADALAAVHESAQADKVVAIGETGLDYYRDYAPREDQMLAFEAQVDLAKRTGLPLVIHTRAAEDDTLGVLRELADGVTVIMHCFSMPDRLDECVERGWMCSFAGNVTYPKATDLQAAARDVPEELLLVETDSPYLSPQPVRGKPNEPANVVRTAAHVAMLRGVGYDELDATVERNAARVFGW